MKLIILLLSFALILTGCTEEISEKNAYVEAQMAVKQHLVAPDTAKFPITTNQTTQELQEHLYHVSADVISENKFSVKLRNDFVAMIEYQQTSFYPEEDKQFKQWT